MSDKQSIPHLLKIGELGEILKIKKTALYAALRNNELPPAIRIGGSWRWQIETVRKWLADKEQTTIHQQIMRKKMKK